jgi:hypothetical protein
MVPHDYFCYIEDCNVNKCDRVLMDWLKIYIATIKVLTQEL